MPSIIDLWDEKKYSEDDPVRQLIAATKAVKEWPMDTLNWGNELVDMTTGGLNKIFPRIPKTHLAKTLPHSIYGDKYDSPSLSEYPAQDVQDGRTVGRLLNPALLFGGNQRVPLPKTGEFNAGRRALITQEAVDDTDKLSAAIEALKNKPMTRRDFNKGMVAGGAAVAASPLLSKFNKTAKVLDDAPEVVQVVKGLNQVEKGSYKYNTLKEYFDAVGNKAWDNILEEADDYGHMKISEMEGPNSYEYSRLSEKAAEDYANTANHSDYIRKLLLEDEAAYKHAKDVQGYSHNNIPDYYERNHGWSPETKQEVEQFRKILSEFSPQAKEEFRIYKGTINDANESRYNPNHPNYTPGFFDSSETPLHWADPENISDYYYRQNMEIPF